MRSNCWKHHCINQHQRGKTQTQTSKECKEKSNPVRANISSQLPPPRICRERKAEGTSQQYTFFWSPVICLVLLSFSIVFGGPGHNGVHCTYCPDTGVPGYHPGAGSALTPTPEQLQQELCCSPPSETWRMSMICPRLHKQSRTDVEGNMNRPEASPSLLGHCNICDAHLRCPKHS